MFFSLYLPIFFFFFFCFKKIGREITTAHCSTNTQTHTHSCAGDNGEFNHERMEKRKKKQPAFVKCWPKRAQNIQNKTACWNFIKIPNGWLCFFFFYPFLPCNLYCYCPRWYVHAINMCSMCSVLRQPYGHKL